MSSILTGVSILAAQRSSLVVLLLGRAAGIQSAPQFIEATGEARVEIVHPQELCLSLIDPILSLQDEVDAGESFGPPLAHD